IDFQRIRQNVSQIVGPVNESKVNWGHLLKIKLQRIGLVESDLVSFLEVISVAAKGLSGWVFSNLLARSRIGHLVSQADTKNPGLIRAPFCKVSGHVSCGGADFQDSAWSRMGQKGQDHLRISGGCEAVQRPSGVNGTISLLEFFTRNGA